MIANLDCKGTYWEGLITLDKWNKVFTDCNVIEINVGGEEITDSITEIHNNGYLYIVNNQETILKKILSYIYTYYCEVWDEYELHEYFEFVSDENEIARTIKPHRIYLLNFENKGIPYIGYEFYCDWENEHGLGIMLYKDELVDIGFADIAFSSEIAEEHLELKL